jgi:[ribosomal protein S5]-alanine N-acetyltransferase
VSVTRLVTLADADAMAELYRSNRDFLAPWEPVRNDDFYTAGGQRAAIGDALARHAQGIALPHVILDGSDRLAGRISLNNIVRGAFQSCDLGYWVSAAMNGRGLATGAVREMIGAAFSVLGLHRIQAATLPHNAASRKVLARNGFTQIGMAPEYLYIAGRWQDHVIFQVVAPG